MIASILDLSVAVIFSLSDAPAEGPIGTDDVEVGIEEDWTVLTFDTESTNSPSLFLSFNSLSFPFNMPLALLAKINSSPSIFSFSIISIFASVFSSIFSTIFSFVVSSVISSFPACSTPMERTVCLSMYTPPHTALIRQKA